MIAIFVIILLDIIGFGIIIPLLPNIQSHLGLSGVQLGLLSTIFSVFQMVGAPLFGIISDKVGRKLVLIVTTIMVAIGYAFTAMSGDSFTMLLLARAFTGFFSGNIGVAFAAAAIISEPKDRPKNMGIAGGAFSLGFVLGPVIGGMLEAFDSTAAGIFLPSLAAAVLALVATIFSIYYFVDRDQKEILLSCKDKELCNTTASLLDNFRNKAILVALILNTFLSMIYGGVETFLSVRNADALNWGPQQNGQFFAFIALVAVPIQIYLLKYLKGKKVVIISFVVYGAALMLLVIHTQLMTFVAGALSSAAFAVLSPNINTSLSLEGDERQFGAIFGINRAFATLGRAAGPLVFGYIYAIHPDYTWYFCGVLSFVCILYTVFFYSDGLKRLKETNIVSNE